MKFQSLLACGLPNAQKPGFRPCIVVFFSGILLKDIGFLVEYVIMMTATSEETIRTLNPIFTIKTTDRPEGTVYFKGQLVSLHTPG